jgi:hypothetical protein
LPAGPFARWALFLDNLHKKVQWGCSEKRSPNIIIYPIGGPMTIRPLNLRRLIIGNPIETAMAQHERITKVKALVVFSSDALSSVA